MNKEIKEIMELIKNNYKDYYIDDFLTGEDVKILVDEIERLKEYQESYRTALDFWKIQFFNKEDIIDKAIEYIKDRYDGEVLTHTFDKCNVKDLLEILRGKDNE